MGSSSRRPYRYQRCTSQNTAYLLEHCFILYALCKGFRFQIGRSFKELINYATPGKIAAFFAESIQGVGGFVEFPQGYLQHAYEHVRAAGGLCIADEVQTGFGRTGTHFWGFETQGVIPDIVTLAKGIGNGAPLAAVVTTPKIAAVISILST